MMRGPCNAWRTKVMAGSLAASASVSRRTHTSLPLSTTFLKSPSSISAASSICLASVSPWAVTGPVLARTCSEKRLTASRVFEGSNCLSGSLTTSVPTLINRKAEMASNPGSGSASEPAGKAPMRPSSSGALN